MARKRKKNGGCLALIIICLCAASIYWWPQIDKYVNEVDKRPTMVDNAVYNEKTLSLEIPVSHHTKNCQTVEHMGYTVLYDSTEKIPQWVAYSLTAAEASADLPRHNKFMKDPDILLPQAEDDDYKGSGWDRGHMAPAGDMKWSSQAMLESFYLSNICPQSHNVNAGDWKVLEELCRKLAIKHKKIYIACGPVINKREFGTIGSNCVTVPDGFFKVILLNGRKGWCSIGFLFNNRPGHKKLSNYACTVDRVEEVTGIDFFPAMEDEIEDIIESKCNPQQFDLPMR